MATIELFCMVQHDKDICNVTVKRNQTVSEIFREIQIAKYPRFDPPFTVPTMWKVTIEKEHLQYVNIQDIDIRAIDEKEKVVLSMTQSIQEYWPGEGPISGYIHVMVANIPKETIVSPMTINIPDFETSLNITIPERRVFMPEGGWNFFLRNVF